MASPLAPLQVGKGFIRENRSLLGGDGHSLADGAGTFVAQRVSFLVRKASIDGRFLGCFPSLGFKLVGYVVSEIARLPGDSETGVSDLRIIIEALCQPVIAGFVEQRVRQVCLVVHLNFPRRPFQ